MQPKCVRFPFATTDGPFTTIGTNGVFPFWLNLILEAMEVGSHIQLARLMDIVVKAPEVLDGGEGVDGVDGASPGRVPGLALRVVEPEGPGVLQRVGPVVGLRESRGVVVRDLALLPLLRARRRRPGLRVLGHRRRLAVGGGDEVLLGGLGRGRAGGGGGGEIGRAHV